MHPICYYAYSSITHCWDELNRLQGSADKKHNACYLYDAGGDRFYKFSGTPDIMYVNGQWHTYLTFSDPTLYASPYLVATNKGYTKHYYAESERIASKIGGGGLQNLHAVCDELYTDNTSAGSAHVLPRPYAELPELDFEAKRDSSKMHLKRLAGCIGGEMGEIKENILVVLNQYAAGAQASPHSEDECYWYHPDHLGSASWVSDKAGKGIQHLYYLPWGEELDNQRATDYASRYTFSGKERDMETGYSYFGARYYNSDLSIWLSVDPLADKYPGTSPYTYCANNPVRLVDPDGREVGDYFDLNGKYLGWDGIDDQKVYVVTDRHAISYSYSYDSEKYVGIFTINQENRDEIHRIPSSATDRADLISKLENFDSQHPNAEWGGLYGDVQDPESPHCGTEQGEWGEKGKDVDPCIEGMKDYKQVTEYSYNGFEVFFDFHSHGSGGCPIMKSKWIQPPSPKDRSNTSDRQSSIYHRSFAVFAMGEKNVYFYNGNRNCEPMSFDTFVNITKSKP